MSFNKITLYGRIAQEPELRYLPNGNAVLTFSIPDNQKRKDEELTTWFRISMFGKRAETLSQFLQKGSECFVLGKLSINEWVDREGKTRSSAEIFATDIEFVGKRPETQTTAPQSAGSNSVPDDFPF